MSILTEVRHQIRRVREQNYHPVRIELGEQQARELADELNASIPVFDPVLLAARGSDCEPPKPVTWEQISRGDGWLWGVRMVGVESPDYLNVVGEDVSA